MIRRILFTRRHTKLQPELFDMPTHKFNLLTKHEANLTTRC